MAEVKDLKAKIDLINEQIDRLKELTKNKELDTQLEKEMLRLATERHKAEMQFVAKLEKAQEKLSATETRLLNIQNRKNELLQQGLEQGADHIEIQTKLDHLNKQEEEHILNVEDLKEKILSIQKEINVEKDYELKKIKEELEITANSLEFAEEKLEIEKEKKKLLKEQAKVQEKMDAEREKYLSTFEQATHRVFAATLGISDAWKSGFLGAGAFAAQATGLEATMGRLKEAISDAMANLGPSMFEKVAEATLKLAYSQDEARASFVAATGEIDDQLVSMLGLARQYSFAGVGAREFGQNYAELSNAMKGFNKLSQEQQLTMTANVAMLERLGISGGMAAKTHADLIQMFGLTVDQSQEVIRSFASLAGAGISMAEAVDGFNRAMPTLLKYGSQSIDVYKKLTVAAKTLQMSTDSLVGTFSQFDTFESAANAAGSLNAILGGDLLNSVELLTATEGERLEMMMKAMEMSGKSWDTMDQFERKAIANAAGISDMSEAQKIFTQDLRAFRNEQTKAMNSGMSAEELRKRAELTQTIKDDLMSIFDSMGLSLAKVLPYIKDITSGMADINKTIIEATDGFAGLGTIIGVVGGIFGLFFTAKAIGAVKNIANLGKVTSDLAGSAGNAANKASNLASGVGKTNAAAAGGAKNMLAFGGAILMAGAGIGLAAFGLSKLVESFKGMSEVMALIVTGGFLASLAIGILAIGAAGKVSAAGLLAFGAAALMVGAGIGLASLGISVMAKSLSLLNGDEMLKIAAGIGGIFLSSLGAPLAAVGIFLFSAAIVGLAGSIALLDTSKLENMVNMFEGITNMKPEVAVTFNAVTDDIVRVSEALKGMDVGTAVAMNVVRDIVENRREGGGGGGNQAGGGGGSANSSHEFTFNISLDGEPMKKFVVDVINGETKMRKPT